VAPTVITSRWPAFLKRALNDALRQVGDLQGQRELLDRRYDRLQSYGRFNRYQGGDQVACWPLQRDGRPWRRPLPISRRIAAGGGFLAWRRFHCAAGWLVPKKWPGQVQPYTFTMACRRQAMTLSGIASVLRATSHTADGQTREWSARRQAKVPEDAARRARYKAFEAVALVDYAQAAILKT